MDWAEDKSWADVKDWIRPLGWDNPWAEATPELRTNEPTDGGRPQTGAALSG